MNAIVQFELCTLTNEELVQKVDQLTDQIYQTGKIPSRYIPARPNDDYDLLVGELCVRFAKLTNLETVKKEVTVTVRAEEPVEEEPMMKVLSQDTALAIAACPEYVPMRLLNEEWAQRNHGQSLQRLNERGGLSVCEILANMSKRRWHPVADNIAVAELNTLLKKLS
ncbi:hypothetical protein [Fibrella forsythiae]|uniref:Uncharacterized protein n=1 Tax=Fibrella forsythiae TaxID=2817061 RepID=A0ABS3JBE4_9BACT|nr:hypothetical protein [Fibrella forsythiae]MBO0947315.1 hypothetical protein [Fibrella forsythiae]